MNSAAPGESPREYQQLEARYRRMSDLGGALRVLHWDRSTVMPDGGAEARAAQMATLSVLVHGLETDPELSDLLEAAEARSSSLDDWQAANLREIRRSWRHANAVPAELVEARSRCASDAEITWRTARENDDFASLAPKLETLLSIVREVASAKSTAFGCSAYEALLDAHDPGRRVDEIDRLFAELEGFLPGAAGAGPSPRLVPTISRSP